MNVKLKLLILASILAFTACKNSGRKSDGAQSEYEDASLDDANQIIQYNNVLVGFTDRNSNYVRDLEHSLQGIQRDLNNPNDQFAFHSVTSPIEMPDFNYSAIKPDNPPSALNSDDRAFFKENVSLLNTTVKTIRETAKQLYDYIRAEDFKDDHAVKGKKLVDSIYALNDKYYACHDKLLAKLTIVAEGAERVTLKSHPLKEYIFAMKDDQDETRSFYDMMGKHAKDYNKAEQKVKALYQSMEKNQRKHAAMDAISEYKFAGKQSSFTYFYDDYNKYLVSARKIMRDASSSGQVSEEQLEELYRQEESMRLSYNRFVQ
jgi:hypothetical protein